MSLKRTILGYAEVLDAWRVVPRILVFLYGLMVYSLINWYRSMDTVEELECNNIVLDSLIAAEVDPERAMQLACTVVDVVGGPTTEQTAFATAIIGLATAIFGFYVNTGRKWDREFVYRAQNPESHNPPTNNKPPMNYNLNE